MSKTIALLGSTGSIGRQTLEVAAALGIEVSALTAKSSVALLEEQCRRFKPRLAVCMDRAGAAALRVKLADTAVQVRAGMDGLVEAATQPQADTVVTAVMGMVGLLPTLEALKLGKRVALANKETMVCAGQLVMDTARAHGGVILPVDSEHSAIFQCLQAHQPPLPEPLAPQGVPGSAPGGVPQESGGIVPGSVPGSAPGPVSGAPSPEPLGPQGVPGCWTGEVKRLILTASGGPFFGKTRGEMARMTVSDALAHPNWAMGAKITVDSATMMNKGLEVIEAMGLYGLPLEKISVVIHRESIIHSMVEYCDNAVLAQLGAADMRLPIQYALTYPRRLPGPAQALDLLSCKALTFQAPDEENFPCLGLARAAARAGGTATAILNGANEAAVGLFLAGRIGFGEIAERVQGALEGVSRVENPTLEDVLEADQVARRAVLGA